MPNTVFVEQFKSASINSIACNFVIREHPNSLCPTIQDQPMMKNESRFEGVEVGYVLRLYSGHVVPKVQAGG